MQVINNDALLTYPDPFPMEVLMYSYLFPCTRCASNAVIPIKKAIEKAYGFTVGFTVAWTEEYGSPADMDQVKKLFKQNGITMRYYDYKLHK